MTTVTVQNSTIKVTVPQSVFVKYMPAHDLVSIMPSGDRRTETRESVARGRILSKAMSVIGNTSELAFIEQETFSDADVENLARKIMLLDYLAENGRYGYQQTVMRAEGGFMMPHGMQQDWEQASRHSRTEIPKETLELAKRSLEQTRDIEISYRTFKSKRPEWDIEIIGNLPAQIGLCRVNTEHLINSGILS